MKRIPPEEELFEPAGPASILKQRMIVDTEIDVSKYLKLLTLEQKIGQRFITWIDGMEVTERTRELIQKGYVAGVILYPWNIENEEQVKRLTSGLQQAAGRNIPPINLFICVDQEGGRVSALKLKEITRFPAAYYWGRYDDPSFITAVAYITCREIIELGCNVNFAPVLDLYGRPDATIIGDRSMGTDPVRIGEFGIYYLKGAFKAGIIPVIKHFPGHGSTIVDSHGKLPKVEMEKDVLMEMDFKPFKMVIDYGAEALMTAHILFTKIDPEYPVTLSRHIIRDILRKGLGFKGVVISDGMAMGALSDNYSVTETLKLLFKAGVDLILVHSRYDLLDLKTKVKQLYEQGEITEEEINEGVERILNLKAVYGLITRS